MPFVALKFLASKMNFLHMEFINYREFGCQIAYGNFNMMIDYGTFSKDILMVNSSTSHWFLK